MLLAIRHRTELGYDAPISETAMELRMTPETTARQVLRGFGIAVAPPATLHEHVDWSGNRVHSFSIAEAHDRVVILAHSAVETRPAPDPFEAAPGPGPEAGDPRLLDYLRFEGPVTADRRIEEIARQLGLAGCATHAEVGSRICHGLRGRLEYRRGVTTSLATVSDALERGAGVCQDFAHLAIALLRHTGVPARYVSGYLYRPGAEEVETHAWVEAHLPGRGWSGFDPTHAEVIGLGHVAVATGRSYADVPPNRGVYRGAATETIRVVVRIDEVVEVPRGLLAPAAAGLDVATLALTAADHRERLDYQQQEQQQQ